MMKLINILLAVVVGVYFAGILFAQEHPGEHPGAPAKVEQEEQPGAEAMLSAEEIIKGIKDYINKITKANAGYFSINDPEEGKDLRLKLIKVHEDRVSYIKKEDAYFACTDFKTAYGNTTYDIDFWMKKTREGELEVYRTKIHKKDGTPRFTYRDDEIAPVESGHIAPEEHT